MNKSKYAESLKQLLKRPVFSSAEGKEAGIPARMLAYFCSKGQIERVGRGIYRVKDSDFDRDFEWGDLVLTALSIPNGVICLISALCYYGLTDEIMREFWIAVPHSTTAPSRENAHIVRMRNTSLGKTIIKIGDQKLKIFDRERTVVDAFRYLDKEVALKALQAYLKISKNTKPDIGKLLKYAKKLRVDLIPYVLAFTI
jgi:predicted transcriptional regulator of viral defense system